VLRQRCIFPGRAKSSHTNPAMTQEATLDGHHARSQSWQAAPSTIDAHRHNVTDVIRSYVDDVIDMLQLKQLAWPACGSCFDEVQISKR
jgi:hypothetical protein